MTENDLSIKDNPVLIMFPAYLSNFSSRFRKLLCMMSLAYYRCPCLCLSSPSLWVSMSGICYAEERESALLASLLWSTHGQMTRSTGFYSRISQKGWSTCLQTFASLLYFRWFSQSCYIWQHSLLAFDKQLLPNVRKETCQMLQLRFNCRKKRCLKKPFATELLSDMPALKLQGTPVGTNC